MYGTWDLFLTVASENEIENLIVSYKRGKFLEKLYGKFSDTLSKSSAGMTKAVATKYSLYLSRRKYNMMCKIQKTAFSEKGCSNDIVSYGNLNISLKCSPLSDKSVEQFVKSLDIGEINVISGYSGVSRTVTALVTMIVDLNLKVKSLHEKLIWFNGNVNHFIVEFSDDGAPESREKTMTIGTLSMWNFGGRIRSREYHYPLHMITVEEKDAICELLWKQHSEEMELIEGNIFTINGEKTTFEFVPSADISWLCFAANVLPTSATYPSPFANVHKGQLTKRNGTIGGEGATWKVPEMKTRLEEVEKLKKFKETLDPSSSESSRHNKRLEFMAKNGIRQLGYPRIGKFADCIRPEPLHIEINNWQHLLDLIYKEAVRRDCFPDFIKILENPAKESDDVGCGLRFVAKGIKEHHQNEQKRFNKLETRLIGDQVISLAQYSFRLVDILEIPGETKSQMLKRLALGKICQTLRDVGVLINQVHINGESYASEVYRVCKLYFDMFSLFYPESCNSTVWTMGCSSTPCEHHIHEVQDWIWNSFHAG